MSINIEEVMFRIVSQSNNRFLVFDEDKLVYQNESASADSKNGLTGDVFYKSLEVQFGELREKESVDFKFLELKTDDKTYYYSGNLKRAIFGEKEYSICCCVDDTEEKAKVEAQEKQSAALADANVNMAIIYEELDEKTEQLAKEKTYISLVLESIHDGLVVVNSDMTLEANCSKAALELLGQDSLEGKTLLDVLFPEMEKLQQQDEARKIEDAISSVSFLLCVEQFGSAFENIPTAIRFPDKDDPKVNRLYKLSFAPIIDNDSIHQVIVNIADHTEIEQLKDAVSFANKRIVASLKNVRGLVADTSNMGNLRGSLEELIPLAESAYVKIDTIGDQDIDSLFRELHTVKGGVRTFKLDYLQHFAHEIEDVLGDIRSGRKSADDVDKIELSEKITMLKEGLLDLKDVVDAVHDDSAPVDYKTPWCGLEEMFQKSTGTLATELGKEVNFKINSKYCLVKKDFSILQKSLIHMVRNAVDHAIELPESRLNKNKDRCGLVEVIIEHDANYWNVIIKDDGGGINFDAVMKKALDKGIIDSINENISKEEILDILTSPGFSSVDNITMVSGRGVGLDFILHELKEFKGSLKLLSTGPSGTQFEMRWLRQNDVVMVDAKVKEAA